MLLKPLSPPNHWDLTDVPTHDFSVHGTTVVGYLTFIRLLLYRERKIVYQTWMGYSKRLISFYNQLLRDQKRTRKIFSGRILIDDVCQFPFCNQKNIFVCIINAYLILFIRRELSSSNWNGWIDVLFNDCLPVSWIFWNSPNWKKLFMANLFECWLTSYFRASTTYK